MGKIVEGKIEGTYQGYAFLTVKEGGVFVSRKNTEKGDVFISAKDLHGALDGDEVLCEIIGKSDRDYGVVKSIVKRKLTGVTGCYLNNKHGGKIVPDNSKISSEVVVAKGCSLGAKTGDKVYGKITNYNKNGKIEVDITEIFGRQYDFDAELKCLYKTYIDNETFSKKVVKEAEEKSAAVSGEERKIFSGTVFTIDGEDAKDFDDAVSIEKRGGFYHLGVHIADVSSFVTENGAIDREAFNRGTSVYFPEKVVPMLPGLLCDDMCSLREGVERLTLSVYMKIDKSGEVAESKILKDKIISDARLTYGEVDRILSGEKTERNFEIVKSLRIMRELSEILLRKRKERGALFLESGEAEISRKDGKITVLRRQSSTSRSIIEEFMILANETVAGFLEKKKLPCVYRTHASPTEEKTQNFFDFVKSLGLLDINEERSAKNFPYLLEKFKGKDYYDAISFFMLRSVPKAEYTEENIGHFGLASKSYCHFTSPIRRYPDLVVHRIVKAYLDNGENFTKRKFTHLLGEVCKQSSEKEKNAETAEREVDKFYKVYYLAEKIGETFDGIISGVTDFGIFVELPDTSEGLVPIENLKGGRVKLNETKTKLSCGRKTYVFGEKVKIKIVGADFAAKRAEFIFVEENS